MCCLSEGLLLCVRRQRRDGGRVFLLWGRGLSEILKSSTIFFGGFRKIEIAKKKSSIGGTAVLRW